MFTGINTWIMCVMYIFIKAKKSVDDKRILVNISIFMHCTID